MDVHVLQSCQTQMSNNFLLTKKFLKYLCFYNASYLFSWKINYAWNNCMYTVCKIHVFHVPCCDSLKEYNERWGYSTEQYPTTLWQLSPRSLGVRFGYRRHFNVSSNKKAIANAWRCQYDQVLMEERNKWKEKQKEKKNIHGRARCCIITVWHLYKRCSNYLNMSTTPSVKSTSVCNCKTSIQGNKVTLQVHYENGAYFFFIWKHTMMNKAETLLHKEDVIYVIMK